MRSLLRISREMFESVITDLKRPHKYAYERVGFLMCKSSLDANISYPYQYIPVEDNDYIKDKWIGAKINSNVIRKTMQNALDMKCGVFHVHLHDFSVVPWFSGIDYRSLIELIPSFQAVSSDNIHGGLVLSQRYGSSLVLNPNTDKLLPGKVSIIGFPSIIRCGSNGY